MSKDNDDEDVTATLQLIEQHIQELRKKNIDWKSFKEGELYHLLCKGKADYERLKWDDLK